MLNACPRRRVDQRDAARGFLLAALLHPEDSVYTLQHGYQRLGPIQIRPHRLYSARCQGLGRRAVGLARQATYVPHRVGCQQCIHDRAALMPCRACDQDGLQCCLQLLTP